VSDAQEERHTSLAQFWALVAYLSLVVVQNARHVNVDEHTVTAPHIWHCAVLGPTLRRTPRSLTTNSHGRMRTEQISSDAVALPTAALWAKRGLTCPLCAASFCGSCRSCSPLTQGQSQSHATLRGSHETSSSSRGCTQHTDTHQRDKVHEWRPNCACECSVNRSICTGRHVGVALDASCESCRWARRAAVLAHGEVCRQLMRPARIGHLHRSSHSSTATSVSTCVEKSCKALVLRALVRGCQ